MQFLEASGDGLKLLIRQTGGTVSSRHLSVCQHSSLHPPLGHTCSTGKEGAVKQDPRVLVCISVLSTSISSNTKWNIPYIPLKTPMLVNKSFLWSENLQPWFWRHWMETCYFGICHGLNPQCESIKRRVSGAVMRSWGWSPLECGISLGIRGLRELCLPLPPREEEVCLMEVSLPEEQALTRHPNYRCLDLGFPRLQNYEQYILVYKLLGLCYFVIVAWMD